MKTKIQQMLNEAEKMPTKEIRRKRELLGISYNEIALHTGISAAKIKRYEEGRRILILICLNYLQNKKLSAS